MICESSDNIAETVDIQNHLYILLKAVCRLHESGLLDSITRTLLVDTIMKATSKYITDKIVSKLIDDQDACWGSGLVVNGNITSYAWSKIVYVGVHLSLLNLCFVFHPFDNHYEVHRRYSLSEEGKKFLSAPTTVMSINPHSYIIDRVLDDNREFTERRCIQNRGIQKRNFGKKVILINCNTLVMISIALMKHACTFMTVKYYQ